MAPVVETLRPRVVGELACQRNSYLRTLETVIISCKEAQKENQSNTQKTNKKTKGESKRSSNNTETKLWEIEFADSVLFPEGGGQPTDHGSIHPIDRSEESTESISITNVQRQGMRCICFSSQPLEPGTSVRQEIDFSRRWDHMQQHTGQHLLSAIMDTYDDLNTLSWSMGAKGEMNYIELPRKPSQQEIDEIQRKCNEIIQRNLAITVETPEDLNLEKLPEDYDQDKGIIRVIKIGDLDNNACCGTHLKQTSHISLLLLHHTQTIRGTNCRLFFTAGDRAINLATPALRSQRSVAQFLSAQPEEVLEKVERMSQNLTESNKREKRLLMDIAKFEAEKVKRDIAERARAFVYRADGGLDWINLIVAEVKDTVKDAGAVVLASGEGKKGGPILIVGEDKAVMELTNKVTQVLKEVKGGGKAGRWQGKVAEWHKGELEILGKAVEDDQ